MKLLNCKKLLNYHNTFIISAEISNDKLLNKYGGCELFSAICLSMALEQSS